MRRHAVLAAVLLLAACGDGSIASEPVAPSACPSDATCVEAVGDVDGDGAEDRVAAYFVGEELAPSASGIVVLLHTGRRLDRPDDRWYRTSEIGLIGVAPLDDLPGDEVVVATSSGPHGAYANVLHLVGGELTPVEDQWGQGDPLQLSIGGDDRSAGGFSCDDTDGDGHRELQLHTRYGDPQWRVDDYRWSHGEIEKDELEEAEDAIAIDTDDGAHIGVRCEGFARYGIDGVAHRPEPDQPLCPPSSKCQSGRGDVDGDGRLDDVTYYETSGEDLLRTDSGIVVQLAGGSKLRHTFTFPDDDGAFYGGLAGIAPLDDLPGEEVVALVQAGAHGRTSRMVHWVDGELRDVIDPDDGGPLELSTDGALMSAGGFSCRPVEPGGPAGFQIYSVGRTDETTFLEGELVSYRWTGGRLVEIDRTAIHGTDDDGGRWAGNHCPDVADYPESAHYPD